MFTCAKFAFKVVGTSLEGYDVVLGYCYGFARLF